MQNRPSILIPFLLITMMAFSFSGAQTFAEEKKTYRVYVEELPYWADNAIGQVELATEYWKQRDGINFVFVGKNEQKDIIIQWVKEYGHETAGQQYYNLIQIGLGNSYCDNTWFPFSSTTVKNIIIHELGHRFGYDHEMQEDSYMYQNVRDQHYAPIKINEMIPGGEEIFAYYKICNTENSSTVTYSVETSNKIDVINVYLVPTFDETKGPFPLDEDFRVYTNGICSATNIIQVSGTCHVDASSYILVTGFDSKITYLKVTMTETNIVPKKFTIYTPNLHKEIKYCTEITLHSTPPEMIEGNIIVFKGFLVYYCDDGNCLFGVKPDLEIVLEDKNNYKLSNGQHLPITLGRTTTDDNGNFEIRWKTIKQTGMTFDGAVTGIPS